MISRRNFLRSAGVTSCTVMMGGFVVPKLWVPENQEPAMCLSNCPAFGELIKIGPHSSCFRYQKGYRFIVHSFDVHMKIKAANDVIGVHNDSSEIKKFCIVGYRI